VPLLDLLLKPAQVEPGEFSVAVGGLETTLTLLPHSDVEVHAGDTIPWGMWGQRAGHQLPLPVDLDQYVQDHSKRSPPSDDSHGEVHEATVVVRGSSAGRDAGLLLGGMALGAACAGGTWLAFTRFKRAQQVRTFVTHSSEYAPGCTSLTSLIHTRVTLLLTGET